MLGSKREEGSRENLCGRSYLSDERHRTLFENDVKSSSTVVLNNPNFLPMSSMLLVPIKEEPADPCGSVQTCRFGRELAGL